jgi:hypothetical protein
MQQIGDMDALRAECRRDHEPAAMRSRRYIPIYLGYNIGTLILGIREYIVIHMSI